MTILPWVLTKGAALALDFPFTYWLFLSFPQLEKCQAPLPPAVFFVVHQKASDYVSFECKNQPGTYIGVKDNQLALLEREKNDDENIMFKLSK